MSLTRFMELFQGRWDAFAEQQEDGSYRPVRRRITRDDYIHHGKGLRTYGIYSVNEVQATKFIVWDIDTFLPGPLDAITEALYEMGVNENCYLEEFSGRKGHHVWLPFESWFPASVAWRAGRAVMQRAGVEVECYPKQEEVADLGNLIKLPLGIHRVTGQKSRFIGWGAEGNWVYVQPIDWYQLDWLADQYQEPPKVDAGVRSTTAGASAQETLEHRLGEVANAPEGQRNETLYRTAVWLLNPGVFNREEVVISLQTAAANAGLSNWEAIRTINSAAQFVDHHPSNNPIVEGES